MDGCTLLYGAERGAEIMQLIEEATDGPCPCRAGRPCPLLPPDVDVIRQRSASEL